MAKKKSWRETYIKILLDGPDESEYQYAVELIDEGYAKGSYIKSNTRMGNPIANLSWKGPTTSGREYLDQLQDKVRKQSWSYRFWSGLVAFAFWVVGLLTHAFIQWVGSP